MIKKYNRFFTNNKPYIKLKESISIKDVDKLKKDYQTFTKNFTRIKNGKDLYTVNQYAEGFRDHMDDFVYGKIIGMNTSLQLKDGEFNVDSVRKDVWTFIMYLTQAFKIDIYKVSSSISDREDINKDYYTDVWNKFFPSWDKTRKSKYIKFTKLGKKAFDSIYHLIEMQNKDILDKKVVSIEVLDGAKITKLYIENNEASYISTQKMYTQIKHVFNILKKHRLQDCIKGMGVILDGRVSSWKTGKAEEYDIFHDNITMYDNGMGESKDLVYTLIHEMGHRNYYKILTSNQKKKWEDFFVDQNYRMSEDNIHELKSAMSKLFNTIEIKRNTLKDNLYKVLNFIDDPILKLIIKAIGKNSMEGESFFNYRNSKEMTDIIHDTAMEIRDKYEWTKADYDVAYGNISKEEWREVTEVLVSKLKIIHFNLGAVSGYANKNESEAYAEAFTYWCLDKPMQAIVNDVFTRISGLR